MTAVRTEWRPQDRADQVEDYARRKKMDVEEVQRWLAPSLNYAPENIREEIADR